MTTDARVFAGSDARVFAGSTAILVGVSAYADEEFRPAPAALNSVREMRALLSDPALCGWPPERIRVIPDPVSVSDLGAEIADLAEQTTGVLLLYYVGHGVLTARAKLCLTTTSTRRNRPECLALSITDEERRSFALGAVAEVLAATDPDRAENIAQSMADEEARSWALGRIARVLAVSDPARGERLAWSITDEFVKSWALGHLARVLAATDPDRAERLAWSITGGAAADGTWSILGEHAKAWALAGVARTIAATDPDRAAGLLFDAERVAESIAGESGQASALLDAAHAYYAEPGPDDAPPGDRASVVVIPTANSPVPAQDAGRP